jgi:hypothetical protein
MHSLPKKKAGLLRFCKAPPPLPNEEGTMELTVKGLKRARAYSRLSEYIHVLFYIL